MFVGIDAGSSYIKIAAVDKERPILFKKSPTLPGYADIVREMLPPNAVKVMVTGYCRKVLAEKLGCSSVSEIKAHAVGVKAIVPQTRTAIDVGGQDSKVIRVEENGFSDFVMNDRCAAGTGRFLEMIAGRLRVSVEELSTLAEKADRKIAISSMCAVFAESEVISLLAQGESRENIALAAFDSVAERVAALARGFGIQPPVTLTGGLASSSVFVKLLEEKIDLPITVPPNPQFVGALGCAFIALYS